MNWYKIYKIAEYKAAGWKFERNTLVKVLPPNDPNYWNQKWMTITITNNKLGQINPNGTVEWTPYYYQGPNAKNTTEFLVSIEPYDWQTNPNPTYNYIKNSYIPILYNTTNPYESKIEDILSPIGTPQEKIEKTPSKVPATPQTNQVPQTASNLNWYKKAKLIDKRGPTDINPITSCCMYCNRWATHPENEKASKDQIVWKTENQLDPEDKIKAKNTIKLNDVSSAICPHCWNILEEHNHRIDPKKVKELSLATTST